MELLLPGLLHCPLSFKSLPARAERLVGKADIPEVVSAYIGQAH